MTKVSIAFWRVFELENLNEGIKIERTNRKLEKTFITL
jgi:hypothetical protein